MAIIFCQGSYWERRNQTMECVKRVCEFVNRIIIIAPDFPPDFFRRFPKVEIYTIPWKDNFPEYRNEYLKRCNPGDWVCVADPDEWYGPELCQDLKTLTEEADKKGIGLLLVNSHDVDIQPDGKRDERVSNFFKNLIFKYQPEVHYEGVGEAKNVHETLIFPPGTKQATLPRKYYYEHIKTLLEIKERGARNVWIGGGGNNVGDKNPMFIDLRRVTERLGLKSWPEVRKYIREGNIDAELREVITKHKDDSGWDWENESRDWFLWYKLLHPSELEGIESQPKEPSFGCPAEVMSYVEQCYLEILGRHADTSGKAAYTNAILAGKIRREDLPAILKSSDEYKQKFGVAEPEGERVSVSVPVNVDVRVGEDSFLRALMKSRTYWEKIRPKLELADKWNRLLNVARKAETCGKGVDESPKENFIPFVETLSKYAPPSQYSHVLDIGAGCGAETSALQDKGYKVVGITFGKDNIKYAKERYGINLIEMDIHNLQFPEGYFDIVFGIQTFEHAFSAWLLVIEFRRVLRDGGIVFIDVPDPEDEAMFTIWHTNLLYPKQIKHLFRLAGFKEVTDLSQKHRLAFLFEKLPNNSWPEWGYVKYIMGERK